MWFWLFLASVALVGLLLYYIRWLIKTIAIINEDVEKLQSMMIDFSEHAKSVYELEIFYGDETLKSLIEHASKLSDSLRETDLILNQGEETDAAEDHEETP